MLDRLNREHFVLEDTLVVWTTEFGRMPFAQGSLGRDHNGGVFTSWLAGGEGSRHGVRPARDDSPPDGDGW